MRFVIECELKNGVISTDYNRKLLSCFKKSLELYSDEVQKSYYGEPSEKDMTFSCFLPILKIENEKIYLKENKFKIFITFNMVIDAVHFYNSFLKAKKGNVKFKLEENEFCINNVAKISEKQILEDTAIFQILSPLVIKEKITREKEWFHILDKKGIEVLKKNIQFSLSKKFSKEKLNTLEILPINIKKTVVNFYNIKFPASKGIFAIKGDNEILNYFYRAGIGSKKSSGFGMLELLK